MAYWYKPFAFAILQTGFRYFVTNHFINEMVLCAVQSRIIIYVSMVCHVILSRDSFWEFKVREQRHKYYISCIIYLFIFKTAHSVLSLCVCLSCQWEGGGVKQFAVFISCSEVTSTIKTSPRCLQEDPGSEREGIHWCQSNHGTVGRRPCVFLFNHVIQWLVFTTLGKYESLFVELTSSL